jgi:hypothetical protein
MIFGDVIKSLNTRDKNESMKTLNDEGIAATVALEPNSRNRPFSKSELRKDSRRKAFERVEKSASLATTYPCLKALKVDLLYFDREIVSWGHGLRYRANLETAKSMLHFDCPSPLCKNGGFDLSKDLSSAIAERQKSAEGTVRCLGFRDQETGKPSACETVLHFKMNLAFKSRAITRRAGVARKPAPMRNRTNLNYETQ